MQVKNLDFQKKKIGVLPLVEEILRRLGFRDVLRARIGQARYETALCLLLKNILVDHCALYAIQRWARPFDPVLAMGKGYSDDTFGRALDRLAKADRASLQTEVILRAMERFEIRAEHIHNDSTTVKFTGRYPSPSKRYVQLKKGHSKDHRPDLKQLLYSLCVTADGAVPVHYKVFDGNRTDDTTHQEIWMTLRGLLRRCDFLYVADSKLCVKKTMDFIERERGRWITVVPKTRKETSVFAQQAYEGEIRWDKLCRKRSRRNSKQYETFHLARGLFQLEEGYRIYWYRSSEKRKRDAEDREERIQSTMEKLTDFHEEKRRGPKTARSLLKKAEKILAYHGTTSWFHLEIKHEVQEDFKKTTPGRPSPQTLYRRKVKQIPRVRFRKVEENIQRAQAMDGIFPLTTNTKLTAEEVLQHYRYQPFVEKRHSLLKSILEVAPVFLKKNRRIEALMFVVFLAQLLAALIERQLRNEMKKKKMTKIQILPEKRATTQPTWQQIRKLFENHCRYDLYHKEERVKTFADNLDEIQKLVLNLLAVPKADFS